MSRNVFVGEITRYNDVEEEQAPTMLGEDDDPEHADTLYVDDDEKFFQDTMFDEEEDEEEEQEQPDRASQYSIVEGSVRYRLGDYYVVEGAQYLGGGGQADVYRCYRTGTTDTFAAKIHKNGLKERMRAVIETIRDMEDECESIYKIYAAGYVQGESGQNKAYMIVTKEYKDFDKNSLNFNNSAKEDYEEKLCHAVEDMNNALTTMHKVKIKGSERHIYHSDIKPENIMWDPDGRSGEGCLVLIDFDGGVVDDTDEKISVVNNTGTKLYTAPELARMGKSRVNMYTDNYSLGITFAELVAGVMPVIETLASAGRNDIEEREYYEKYGKKGITIHNACFPPGLPEYVQTLFNGLLYHDYNLAGEKLGQKKRWDDDMLRKWVNLVAAKRYREAAALPCGSVIKKPDATAGPESAAVRPGTVAMPLNDSVKCRIPYNDGVVTIRSVEEMAEQFVKHWSETVNRFVTEEKFPEVFRSLSDDVSYNLKRAQKNMSRNPKRKDEIFDKEVIEVYLSDDFKKENLRCYGRVYASKAEFGQKLYAGLIASRDKSKNAYSRLPEMQKGTSREFNDILLMFSKGIVSGFLTGGNEKWQVDDDTLQMIRKVEQHVDGDRLNAKTVENLYRTAFRLRGKSSHVIGKKTYKDYTDFSQQLLDLAKSDTESAVAIREQCMTGDGRLKVDMYAWMQETEGVVVYPTEKEREQF